MSFVFPVLLGGLALLSVPVLIHLILRQKPKTLPFPAFRFLLKRHKTNLRKLRLRHLLLLALRVLIIAAICFALTRPKLTDPGLGLSRDRPVAAALVIDTSPSMEYQTSEGVSRLEAAKKEALGLLDQLPKSSRLAVIDTGDPVLSLRPEGLLTIGQARERIKDLQIRPLNAPVSKRLAQAYRALAEASRAKEAGGMAHWPRLVGIFSDRTRGAWDGGDREAIFGAADTVPPLFEGLLQAGADIPPVLDLLKDLRKELPPPPGKDYPDQSLREALELLRDRVPGLTREYLPPEHNLEKMINNVRRHSRTLRDAIQTLAPEPGKKDQDGFSAKLTKRLQAVLNDLAGAQIVKWRDGGVLQPVDLAILQVEFPTLSNGQPKQLFSADDPFVVRAVVRATGKDFNTELVCQVGTKTFCQAVDAKAGATVTVPFEIDPAKLKLAPGPHQLELHLARRDQLTLNDQRFATFAIREPRKVLILVDRENAAAVFSGAIVDNKSFYEASPQEKLTAEALQQLNLLDYQAIFLFGVREPDKTLWNALKSYVEGGGGLGVIPGGVEMKKEYYNDEPAKSLLPGAFGNIVDQKEGATWNLQAEGIYQHPLLFPFRAWRNDPNIDLTKHPNRAFQYWEVKPHAGEVLVRYQDDGNSPALLERRIEKGRGKVLLFTTPFDSREPRWNNYLNPLEAGSFYVVVVGLATRYLAGDTEEPALNFLTGREPPRVVLPLAQRFRVLTLRGPDLVEEHVPTLEQGGTVTFEQAAAPGNYTVAGVEGKQTKQVGAFSVNLPAEESDLTRVPAEELESVLGPDVLVPLDSKDPLRDFLPWQEPVELFAYLMVLLLVFLAVENLVANKFYRKET